jgi:ATP-dependent exoDNAse (exonuclease V) beta subunit
MTRARDHLVLCLHHRQRAGGGDTSLAALVSGICARNPGLWRRLPVVAPWPGSVATGPEPVETAPLPVEGEADRTRLWASLGRPPATTATAVAGHVRAPTAAPSAVDRGCPPAGDRGRRVEGAVHGALAQLDPSTGGDASGRSTGAVARASALAHGVPTEEGAVTRMVGRALSSPTVVRAATRRHWRAVPVAAPVGPGGVLESTVDLLFEDDDGLVVVEYHSERLGNEGPVATMAPAHRLHLAASALAVACATDLPVGRGVLVFLGDDGPRELVLQGDALATAMDEARRLADALVVA